MGDGVTSPSPARLSYTESFEAEFPKYLAIGMTYEQYWEMDPSLAIAYRKADRIRQMRMNEQSWLQGCYIYEALCAVSPVLHAFAKNGTKPRPYLKKPYEMALPKRKDAPPTSSEQEKMEAGKSFMRAFMAGINKKFEKKGVGEDAQRGRAGTSNPG